jgi:FkbM family methyltransferase
MVLNERQYNLNRRKRVNELLSYAQRNENAGLRPLIIDAGANIGASSIYFLANMPNACVIAIEPNQGNFELLCRNTQGLSIQPIRAALAASSGRCRVVDTGLGHWRYRTSPVGAGNLDGELVDCVTVADIYASHASSLFPFIVKIDIEGAEGELFTGNTGWLARTPLIIIELHDWLLPRAGTSQPFLRCVSALARDFISIGEDIYSIAHDLDTCPPPPAPTNPCPGSR